MNLFKLKEEKTYNEFFLNIFYSTAANEPFSCGGEFLFSVKSNDDLYSISMNEDVSMPIYRGKRIYKYGKYKNGKKEEISKEETLLAFYEIDNFVYFDTYRKNSQTGLKVFSRASLSKERILYFQTNEVSEEVNEFLGEEIDLKNILKEASFFREKREIGIIFEALDLEEQDVYVSSFDIDFSCKDFIALNVDAKKGKFFIRTNKNEGFYNLREGHIASFIKEYKKGLLSSKEIRLAGKKDTSLKIYLSEEKAKENYLISKRITSRKVRETLGSFLEKYEE